MSKFRKGASSEEIRDTQKGSIGQQHGFLFDRDDEVDSYVAQIMNGQTTLESVPEELQTNVKSELRANGFKQTSKNEGAKMSITRSMIRRLVNEELNSLREEEEPPAVKAVKDFYATDSKDEAELESSYEKLAKELHAAGAKDLSSIEAAVEAADHDPSSIAQDLLRRVAKLNESRNLRRLILRELRQQGII